MRNITALPALRRNRMTSEMERFCSDSNCGKKQGFSINSRHIIFIVLIFISFSQAHAARVQEVVAENGITAWLIEDHSLPMFTAQIAFRNAGSAYDPPNRRGLALFVSRILREGAGEMDALAYAEALDRIAAELSFNVNHDTFNLSLQSLSEHASEAFHLSALALTRPRFEDAALERVRSKLLSELVIASTRVDYRATEAFHQAAFGTHSYGKQPHGDKASLGRIGKADLSAFVHTRLRRGNIVVAVAGDMTPETLKHVLDDAFSALPAGEPQDTLKEAGPMAQGGHIIEVAMDDVPQTVVTFGLPGIARQDEDFYTFFVLNHLLGGSGLNSRLATSIRREAGLTYYAYTYPDLYRHAALLRGVFASRSDEAGRAIGLLRETLAKAASEGFSQAELDNARSYLTGSFPLSLDSTGSLTSYLMTMQMEGLGIDYLDKRNAFIEAVTLKEINNLTKRLLKPENLLIVAAGNPLNKDKKEKP